MSKTSWTDQHERVGKIRSSGAVMSVVPAVYVRELEKELADALDEIKGLRQLVNDCHIVAGQLETERNGARAEIERLKEQLQIKTTENLQHIGTIRWYEEMEIPKKDALIEQMLYALDDVGAALSAAERSEG